MLAFLNSFSGDTALPDRALWHDLDDQSTITLGQLQREAAALHSKLEHNPASSWLLYSDDPHYFLLGLLVLLGLKKKIIISASKKPEWLQSLHDKFDAVLSDEPISLVASSHTNFQLPPSPSTSWQPCYNGDEEIVFFTSGSSGQPKAIKKSLAALTNEIDTLRSTFGDSINGGFFCASVSHLHIYGLLFRVLLPMAVGGSSIRQQIEYPEQLHGLPGPALAQSKQKQIFVSSPAFLSRLDLRLAPVKMSAVFSSGGPLAFAAAQDSKRHFSALPVEVYGSTETGGIGYRQQTAALTPWTMFSGLALNSTEEGVELSSPHMPGLGSYLLDDNLELLPEHQFIMKGRKDRIVKIAEKRVSLTEMEKFLETQTAIAQCVALPLLLKREVIACAIVLTPEGRKFVAEHGQFPLISCWKKAMRKRFDNVTIPRKWQILAEIPLNSQSKIDTATLLAGFTRDTN